MSPVAFVSVVTVLIPQPVHANAPSKFIIVAAKHSRVSCTFRNVEDRSVFTTADCKLAWGIEPTTGDRRSENYRCTALTVLVGNQRVGIEAEVFNQFSNLRTASISVGSHRKRFAIHLLGGYGTERYWATVGFRYVDNLKDYEPVYRTIRSVEHPHSRYEKCDFHCWVSHTM